MTSRYAGRTLSRDTVGDLWWRASVVAVLAGATGADRTVTDSCLSPGQRVAATLLSGLGMPEARRRRVTPEACSKLVWQEGGEYACRVG